MTDNPTFVQALADATGRPVEVSPPHRGHDARRCLPGRAGRRLWSSFDDIADAWRPRAVVEPARPLDRAQWADAMRRARGWIPDLSALDF